MNNNKLKTTKAEESGRVLQPLEYQKGFNNAEMLKLFSQHFVKMPSQGVLFKRDFDGNIDFTEPIQTSDFELQMEDLGFKMSDQKWGKILKSRMIPTVEPLQIVHEVIGRAKWSGTDWLTMLVENLNLNEEFEENRRLLNKFFALNYATAFQGYDSKIDYMPDNKICLILYSEERNTRKTSIFRKLGLQGFLRDEVGLNVDVQVDYLGQPPSDKRTKNIHLSSYLQINLDDIDNMLHSANRQGSIRSEISQNTVSYRLLYTEDTISLPRRASYVGTTNSPEVLRDKRETRFLVVEVGSPISDEFLKTFDVLDFWRQMKEEAHRFGRHDISFNPEEQSIIRGRVESHCYENSTELIIRDYLEPCEDCRTPFIQIVKALNDCNLNLSPDKIAKALKTIAPTPADVYVQVKGKKRYKFNVVYPDYVSNTTEAEEGARVTPLQPYYPDGEMPF